MALNPADARQPATGPALASAPDGLGDPARGRAMAVMVLGLTLAVLDSSIVNLALPGIARELNAGASEVIWVVNAYQMGALVLLLPLAALGDRFGYRRVYLLGMSLFMLASVGAMLASSLPALVAARALQGLGAAGIMSVNAALVRLIYPRALLGRGMAINSLVVASASMAGPSVAAGILSVASWPWLFALNVPMGLFIVWRGRQTLPYNAVTIAQAGDGSGGGGASPRFSPVDVLLNVAMFTLVFVGAEKLGVRAEATHSPYEGWVWLAAGVAVGAVYLKRQWRLPAPLFPVDLLRMPVFALSMASSVSAFCAQMLAFLALPFLLLNVHDRSHLEAGLLITAWPLATVVVAPLAGRLIGRYADGLLGGVGMAIFAVGLMALALMPTHAADLDMVWRMALCGAGFALFQAPNNHTIVTSAPLHGSGAASGMLGTGRLTGQILGAVVLAGLYAVWSQHDGQAESIALMLAAGGAVLAGVFSSLRLRRAA